VGKAGRPPKVKESCTRGPIPAQATPLPRETWSLTSKTTITPLPPPDDDGKTRIVPVGKKGGGESALREKKGYKWKFASESQRSKKEEGDLKVQSRNGREKKGFNPNKRTSITTDLLMGGKRKRGPGFGKGRR